MPNSPADVFDRLSTLVAPAGTRRLFGTACVLGGGLAGLVAARVLTDHADRVVIIEPDSPDAGSNGEPRPGVPQGYQVHVLLPGGRAQLERFFPSIAKPPATEPERRVAWAMRQVRAAAGRDVAVGTAVRAVGFMTAHPNSLAAPELVLRAARLNGVPEEEIGHEYGV